MKILRRPCAPATAHLEVAGEVDMETADQLADAITDTVIHDHLTLVIVDFAKVTFCDSAGLAALDNAYALTRDQDIILHLINVQPDVRRVLEITGMLQTLTQPNRHQAR